MRVLLQRVTHACVRVEGETVGSIEQGLLLLVGAGHEDDETIVKKMAQKIAELRIFNDEQGKMNLSLLDLQGHALVVSQFTLYADARKGRRPSFTAAARPQQAQPLVDIMAAQLRMLGVKRVETGRFGAEMKIDLLADGPVTIWLDSHDLSMH